MSKKSMKSEADANPNDFVQILPKLEDLEDFMLVNKPFVQLVLDENTIVANVLLKVDKGKKPNPRGNHDDTMRRRRTNIDIVEDSSSNKTQLILESIQFIKNPQNNDREAVGFEICNMEDILGHSYILVKSLRYTINDDSLCSNDEKLRCFIPLVHLAKKKENNKFTLRTIVKIPKGYTFSSMDKVDSQENRFIHIFFKGDEKIKKNSYLFIKAEFLGEKKLDFEIIIETYPKLNPEENRTMVGEEDADERDDSLIDL